MVEIRREIEKLEDYLECISFVKSMMGSLIGARPATNSMRSSHLSRLDVNDDYESRSAMSEAFTEQALMFVTGSIKHDECERLKRMIFRGTHGQALVHFKPYKIDGVEKAAYLIVFSMAGNVDRVMKICDSFMG